MKTYTGILNQTDCYNLSYWYKPETVLLFDIETTGFSAKTTTLYLIGMCYYADNTWHYRMLFNDDGRSELTLLTEFLKLAASYQVLLHFNGDGFDLPYLKEKYMQYQALTANGSFSTAISELERLESVDLYKLLKPYRSGLPTSDLKLQTLEKALGIKRTDTFSGGELIKIYHSYLKDRNKQAEQCLLQHNYDDILAMIPMLQLLTFRFMANHDFTIAVEASDCCIRLMLTFPFPLPLMYEAESAFGNIRIKGSHGCVEIPLLHDALRYYLKDWKDYYYLPMEELVIHKSVAAYVDSEFRQKATKENGYLKHTSDFFPCPKELQTYVSKLYKKDSRDSISYAEWNPELSHTVDFWMNYLYSTFL